MPLAVLPERKSGRARAVAGGALLALGLGGIVEWIWGRPLAGRLVAMAPALGPSLLVLMALAGVLLWFVVARLHTHLRAEDEKIIEEAGAEARAAEARFRAALFDSPIPGMLWADSGKVLMINRTWTDLSGYSAEELTSISDWTRMALGHQPPDNLPAFLDARFTPQTRIHDGEREIRTKAGALRVWDFHTASIGRMPTGERLLVTKSVDVTERRAAEERYRALNAELEQRVADRTSAAVLAQERTAAALRMQHAVLDGNVFSIIAVTPEGTIRIFNAGAEKMLQYRREEMIGLRTPEIIHDQDEVVARAQQLSRELGRPVPPGFEAFVAKTRLGELDEREWTYIRKDGSRFPVMLSITALRGADGMIEGFLGIARDITARKAATSALAASEERFRQAFEYAGIGMAIVGLDGRWLRVNAAICEILGYDEVALMTKTLQDITHPEDLDADSGYVRELLAGTRKHYQMEKRYLHRSGRTIWIRLSASLVRDEHGAPVHFVTQIEDVTEHKRLERKLAEARDAALEASRMKSGFLANMSHEIRTPMNAVVAMSSLLGDTTLTAEQREMVGAIRVGSESLLAIINDALDFSQIEAGKLRLAPEEFELAKLLDDTARLLAAPAQAKGLAMAYEVDRALRRHVRGDAGRVRQVFINLLGNAIKFTERGSVVVEVRALAAGAGRVRFRVTVQDSGVGIAPEERRRLFQPFEQGDSSTTRRFGGTGLGLAISRELVEMMGGEIGFESEWGGGSTFWFELELSEAQPMSATQSAVRMPPERPLTLLVIDDNAPNRRVADLLLTRMGHRVELAADGPAGLSRLAAGGIDAVLTDCQMPGMDGYEVTRRIRAGEVAGVPPQLPVIAVTAYATPADRLRSRQAGMNHHLIKPLREETLAALIARLGRDHVAAVPCAVLPAAPEEALEVFDRQALEVVRGLPGSKGGSLLPELVALFQEKEAGQMAELHRHVAARSADAAGATAHAIAGNAAAFGAAELKARLLAVERAARALHWEEADRLVDSVQMARERLRNAIDRENLLTT